MSINDTNRSLPTGAATSAKQDVTNSAINSIKLSASTGVATASGDTTILTVSGGQKVRIYHWSAVPTTSSATDRDIVFKIGSTSIQGWRTNKNGGGWAHSPKNGLSYFEGAINESVIINLSGSDSIRWNLSYELI